MNEQNCSQITKLAKLELKYQIQVKAQFVNCDFFFFHNKQNICLKTKSGNNKAKILNNKTLEEKKLNQQMCML